MAENQTKPNKVALAIIGLLPSAMVLRAGYTFVTGSYWISPRNSPAVEYTGLPAYCLAFANIALAAMIAIWLVHEVGKVSKKQATVISVICGLTSAALYAAGIFG